jgi:hypothetical protein
LKKLLPERLQLPLTHPFHCGDSHNEELYQYLSENLDEGGRPTLDDINFVKTTDKYGRMVFRRTLADYITREKPDFPFKTWPKENVIKKFQGLVSYDWTKWISKRDKEDVLEKYDDYKYPYSEYGLGVIDAPPTFNSISDSFMNPLRLACGSYGYKSPVQRWNEGDNIWGVFGPLWRGINDTCELNYITYLGAFRLGTYIATQFKPTVAKTIYEMTDAKTVLDTSMGWGDRLTGFFASNATTYIGCDPNPNTFAKYKEMIEFYHKLTGGNKTVKMYNCGAEDLPWDEIENIDCAFTSPPYFSTERYNEGGEKEELQSWSKFNEYDRWRDEFYLPVAEKSFNSLSDKGHLLVNILDPKIKGKRYRSGDELVDSLKDHFMGQVGMRIQQRSQGKSVFKDEKGNFDKEAMTKFMDKVYIENVWYFSKDKNSDIFKHTRTGTLESFFS